MLRRRAVAVACAVLAASGLRAERLPVRIFTTADGLPSKNVNGVFQDRRGFVWVITSSGVSRFDGQRFLNFGARDGLPSSSVWQFAETADGGLWFGTTGGLAHLRADAGAGEKLFEVTPFGTAMGTDLRGLLAEGDRLWVGTRRELWRGSVKEGWRFARVPLPADWGERFVSPQLVDGEGSLWLATERGLGRLLPDGRRVFYPLGRETVSGDASAVAGERGLMWVFSSLGVLVWVPEAAAQVGPPSAPLLESADAGPQRLLPGERFEPPLHSGRRLRIGDAGHLATFLVASKGLVLFQDDDGITALEDGVLRTFAHGGVLTGGRWQPLLEDRSGNVWAISPGRGLARIRRAGFVTYGREDGLPSDDVRGVVEDRDGELVAITGGAHRSLALYDGARFTDVTPPAFAAILATSRDGQIAAQSADGDWWFTTWEGVLRLRAHRARDLAGGTPVAIYAESQGFSPPHMLQLLRARDGGFWLSSTGDAPGAALHVDPAMPRAEQPAELRELAPAQSFAEDRAGHLWASLLQGEGVFHRRGTTLRRFRPGEDLPAGTTSGVFVDSRDRVWIGTGGAGILRLDDAESEPPRLVRFSTADGLASDRVLCFTEDRRGRIYAGNDNGVDRLTADDGRIENFTDAEGFVGANVRGCMRDSRGRLWFTTPNGLTRFDPDGEAEPRAPETWLGAVHVAGVVQSGPVLGGATLGPLRLGPSPGTVQFDFLGIAPEGRGTVKFEYRLEPIDRAWSGPTAEHSVLYGALAPGAYRFLVRAIGGEGLASPTPAAVELEILAPLWRRPWFVALVAFAVLALAYAAMRLRMRQLLALERVRTRIAADLHDEMGSTLSTISILSEVGRRRLSEDPQQAAAPLAQIGDSARELMEATSDIVWALDARRDDLDSVLARLRRFAGDLLEPRGIAAAFVVPARPAEIPLSAEQKRELYLFCKEALHNVAKHARARNVRVEVAVEGRRMVAAVIDDGVGFDRAALAASPSREGGHGLPSLELRARRMGGRLRVDSAPGRGTRMVLELEL